MHVCDLHDNSPFGIWEVDWSGVCKNYDDANEVIRVHKPMLRLSLAEVFPREITEITYKDMVNAIDPNFLRQGLRAQALRGLRYANMTDDMMVFYVTSSEIDMPGSRGFQREYLNLIKFMSWKEIASDAEMTPRERALMLLWTSDIQVHCDDPSFLYWGYQYICSQLGASIYPETRRPGTYPMEPGKRRNPTLRGIVCKHLNRVLRALPFYNGDIAKIIRTKFGGPAEPQVDQTIQQRQQLSAQVNGTPPQPEEGQEPEQNALPPTA